MKSLPLLTKFRVAVCTVAIAAVCFAQASSVAAEALTWKFKSGDKLGYEIEMDMSQDIKVSDKNLSVKVVHRMWMTLAIGDVASDGTATITQTVDRMSAEITPPAEAGGGAVLKYDSKDGVKTDADKKDPAIAMMAPVFDAMVGKPIGMKVSPQGDVSDVKVPDAMIDAMKKSAFAQMSNLFTTDGIKQTASRVIVPLPKGDAAEGKTWDSTMEVSVPMVGKQISKTDYKFVGTEELDGKKVAKIDLQVDSKFESEPKGQLKINIKEQKSDGAVYFDNTAGRVVSSSLQDKMTLELEVMGMKLDQVVTSIIKLKQSNPDSGRDL